MKPKNQTTRQLALVTAIAFTAVAQAANLTWDTVSGDGATITAAGGNWDTTTVSWNNAGSNSVWGQTNATTATNAAIFAGADGSEGSIAINVAAAIAAQTLSFNNTGYALSATAARTITVTSTTTPVTISSGKSATIGANVTASFSATGNQSSIAGGGTLKIAGTGATVTKPSNVLNIIGGTTIDVGTSGLLTTSSQIVLGTNSGNGTIIVNGGTVTSTTTTANHNLILANASSANTISGTLTINSGTVTHPAVSGGLRIGNSTTAMTSPNTATGTLNLNGGQFTVARIYEGFTDPLIISNVNFNGGKLVVRAGATNAANFMTGLDAANVLSGGAVIDTNGVDTTIAQALLDGGGGGGLTKQGSGTLTLTGANTYTGNTVISAGKIAITAPYSSLSATTVNSGARLRVTTAATPSSLSSITLNANSGIETNVGTYTTGQLASLSVTNFNAAGDYKIDLAGTSFVNGDITVLSYTNKTGTGVPTLGNLPLGVIGTVEDTGSAIVVHAQLATIWSAGTGSWDTTSTNWTGLDTIYTEGAPVAFPEIAGTNIVTLTADRSPSSVTISNDSTSTYTFTGSSITGSTSISKSGTGVVSFDVGNSYTGVTTINSGGVIANADAALGTADAGTTVASGAALGLTNGVAYTTAEAVTGSGLSTTVANTGPFVSVQRGIVQAVSGSCSFAGPIQINATGITRLGTQNGASLTLSGPITKASGVTDVQVLFRAGNDGDFVTLTNAGNQWDKDTLIFTGAASAAGGVRLGVDNGLPKTVSLVAGGGSTSAYTALDLNGYDQELNGITNSNGKLRILNTNAGDASTLTLNPTANRSNYTIAASLTVIEDGAGKVNLVKNGAFTQTLHDPNTYSGTTTINGGSLQLGSFVANPKTGSIPNSSAMTIAAGANFDVSLLASYAIPSTMPVTLKLDPAASGSAGKIKAGALDITNAVVALEPIAALDDAVYVIADYTSLVGTAFASVTPPSGYTINYAYNGGTQIALVADAPADPFLAWIDATWPSLTDKSLTGDSDQDGVSNLLEYVLKNGNPSAANTDILPTLNATGANFVFTFLRRNASAANTTQTFEYGGDLSGWTSLAIPGGAGVVITDQGDGIDLVEITVAKGDASKLFGRLKVTTTAP